MKQVTDKNITNIRRGIILLWINKAFTVVELIIVITIVAILATIAFVSYQWFTTSSRDANRLSSLTNIEKGLNIFQIKTWKLPFPENSITLLSNWVVIWYQWDIADQTSQLLNFSKTPLEEWDGTYFTYSTNINRNIFQIWWFLEKSQTSFLESTYATSLYYASRYFTSVGSQLWILLVNTWSDINKPLHKLRSEASFTGFEINTFTWTLSNWINIWELKVVFNNEPSNNITWTGKVLSNIEINYNDEFNIVSPNCENWFTESSIYKIPTGGPQTVWYTSLVWWVSWVFKVCNNKNQLGSFSNLHVLMPNCPVWWELSSQYIVWLASQSGHCESNWWWNHIACKVCTPLPITTSFQSWDEVVMSHCPAWWNQSWLAPWWPWSMNCWSQSCKMCKKN